MSQIRSRISLGAAAYYFSVLMISVLFGMVAALGMPILVILPVALVVVCIVAFKFPEMAIVLIYCAMYGLIPASMLPAVSVGSGKLLIHEALLGLVIVSLLITRSGQINKLIQPAKPLIPALVMIGLLWLMSFSYAKFYAHTPINNILTEGRDFFVLLLIFVIPLACSTKQKFRNYLGLMVGFSVILALVVVIQSLFHVRLIEMSRVAELDTQGQRFGGVVRVITEGIFFLVFSLYVLFFGAYYKKINRPVAYVCMLILALGILVSFGRGVWLASIAGLLFCAWVSGRWTLLARMAVIGSIVFSVLLMLLTLFNPDILSALADRFLSIGSEVQSGSSLGWRREENSFAFIALLNNPIVGVGLGGDYKPILDHFGFEGQTRYIHNAYLYLALKFGVLGALFPLLMFFGAIKLFSLARANCSGQNYEITDIVLLCAFAVLLVTLIISFTQPEWMVDTGLAFIATVLGVMVSIVHLKKLAAESDKAIR